MRVTRSMTKKLMNRKRRASTSILEIHQEEKKPKQWKLELSDKRELRSMLECPVCFELPRLKSSGIYGCRNGHVLCQNCSAKVKQCPICRNEDMKCRSLVVEKLLASNFNDEEFNCRNTDCSKRMNLQALTEHELFCQHREVACPSNRRGTCKWNGPLLQLMNHIKAEKCLQVLVEFQGDEIPNKIKIKEALAKDRGLLHKPQFNSSIGDFPEESARSVFDRNDLVTHWKPILMLSRNIMDFWVHLTIERNSKGQWFLIPFAMLPAEKSDQIHIRITVGNVIYEGPVNTSQADKDEALKAGNYLLLNDEQVKKMKKQRKLFNYDLQVKPNHEFLFDMKRISGGCMRCKKCLGPNFRQCMPLKNIK